MRIFFLFFIAFFLNACVGVKLEQVSQDQIKKEYFEDFNASKAWWEKYNNQDLNNILKAIIDNNKDLNVARVNFLSTLARYKLLNLDLYPTLSGNLGVNIRKNLNNGAEMHSFSNGIMLNYELDIYGKISDQVASSEFLAKASEYELRSLELDTINLAINSIFELIYFNDVDRLLNNHLKNLEQMLEIYTTKFNYGKVEYIDLLNIKKSLLNTKQNIITNLQNKDLTLKNIKDLLGKDDERLINKMLNYTLEDFYLQKINFDIELKMLAYRPQVQVKLNQLMASYKDYASVQKSILPSIKILGNLDGSDKNFDESFKFLILGGNVVIDLPFLDFYRVRQNVKISEFTYQARLYEYKDALQRAIHEFKLCYENDKYYNDLLNLVKDINTNQAKITQLYFEKYELGRNELKDYLDADALLINSLQELSRAKLSLLKNINLYHNIVLISE
ncbi:TolC-like outer membrane efflux protein [Campylobacter lari]|uniref:TolC-like outer membrane efflux protein n=1 Tax=Campylobacter lari TaxID=201 RepID=UPI00057F769B|nr:TolC-like outer membrane efflux protein [Campylobacter lari]AJC89278.1 TolC-like outer membrane efflux protein [Campylobacter lari subsp. concheus LMG 11760]EAH7584861.1 TolC-like outer membrane efflux protein [Campylobacter lari]EAK2602637.1 TolC-like outer membrane efflux protein [Campylobacter lari]MCR2081556.1 TolC-like outer membrane efflux protein [Campylobacter lari subsp. concheus]